MAAMLGMYKTDFHVIELQSTIYIIRHVVKYTTNA
jgi:hypothetical protein